MHPSNTPPTNNHKQKCSKTVLQMFAKYQATHLKTQQQNCQNCANKEWVEPGCNCRRGSCPLNGKCLVDKLIHRAKVKDENDNTSTYTGLTANTFKQRFYGHSRGFTNRNLESSTSLSTHIWDLKDKNDNFELSWEVVDRAQPFNPTTRRCGLCQMEKFYNLFLPEGARLNKKSELFSIYQVYICNIIDWA